MKPYQELFDGRLTIIRPLAFLEKEEIVKLSREMEFAPVRTKCPLSEETSRLEVRHLLEKIYTTLPGSKKHIFASLSNVRHEYLLKQPVGRQTLKRS